jgi:hypothetical protein
MKKLILTILASSFILSCSTNSSNDNANNPSSNGLLVKTRTYNGVTGTYNYNGNKPTYVSHTDGSSTTLTFNGDLIIKEESTGGSGSNYINYINTMNYSNNLLISSTENRTSTTSNSTFNSTYTYNSDGSITEIKIGTNTYSGNTTSSSNKYVRFYSQGNCIKQDSYANINGVFTLNGSTTYSYDTNNFPFKNVTGIYIYANPMGEPSVNNQISATNKNASGITTSNTYYTYQYNAQNYPISVTETYTLYTISPSGTSSTPGTSSPSTTTTYSYY